MRLSEFEPRPAAPPADLRIPPALVPRPVHPHDAFDALADPHRRELLRMLAAGGRSVNELAANLPISRPAVSRHLKLLTEGGLVMEAYEGTRHIFRLRPEGARAVQDYLEGVWGSGHAGLRLALEGEEPVTATGEAQPTA
jgi:DNA-binding transcriptional ArsR family regulator